MSLGKPMTCSYGSLDCQNWAQYLFVTWVTTSKPKKATKQILDNSLFFLEGFLLTKLKQSTCKKIWFFIFFTVLPQRIVIGDGVSCRPSVVSYDVTLRGGLSAGKFTPVGHVDSMEACVNLCCHRNTCDIALMLRDSCYSITCASEELCEEVPAPSSDFYPRLSYVRRDNENQTKKGEQYAQDISF